MNKEDKETYLSRNFIVPGTMLVAAYKYITLLNHFNHTRKQVEFSF